MRRVWTLAATPAIALIVGATPARAAHNETPAVAARTSSWLDAGAITALALVPGENSTDLVVEVSGAVSVQDFTVPTPHRVVLDITGARLAEVGRPYDRVVRNGITNIRMSQYRTDVVRIVLDLDGPRAYTVARSGNLIRVSFKGNAQFAAWHSSGTALADAATKPAPNAEPKRDSSVKTVASEGNVVELPQNTRHEPARTVDDIIAGANKDKPADIDTTPERPRAPATPPQRAPLASPQSQQPKITVTYQDADIRDVLAAFATFSGRTIVVGKDVNGTVTAEIKDQPWDIALKAILEAQGLAAAEEASGIITVDSYKNILEKQASEPVTTQMVNINYVSAASLVSTVGGLLYKDCPIGAAAGGGPGSQAGQGGQSGCIQRGTVAADSATNVLIVTEVASRLPALLQYVRGLDVRTPQVALKAKIISVSRTQIEQLGLSYDLGTSGTYFNTLAPRVPDGQTTAPNIESQITLGGEALAGVSNASRKYKTGSALDLIFSTALGKYSLTSFLDALHQNDLSDIQAEPSIVTLDNRQARIFVGQETPVRVIDAGSASQIGTPARANVQFRETGIILTVTPHITNNRQIRMTMEAEQSDLNIVGGDLGFIINKRNAKSQLLVNNGETAVIGGLTQTQVDKHKSGIPILSDLPLIGRLFSQTDSKEQKSDLLIMITPQIIEEGDAVRPPGGSK